MELRRQLGMANINRLLHVEPPDTDDEAGEETRPGVLDAVNNKIEDLTESCDETDVCSETVRICDEILREILDNVINECSSEISPVKPPSSVVRRKRPKLKHQLSQDLSVAPDTGWSATAKLAILVTVMACCANVVFLELLVSKDSGIGNLVTFAQFLLISIEGFLFTTKCGTISPKVPFSAWLVLVIMYFLVNVTNNYALSYNIPMPLHMIFRAGGLLVNMLMGIFIMGKTYNRIKYVSVVMISCGIFLCTVMSATNRVSIKTGKVIFYNETETEEHVLVDDFDYEELRQMVCGVVLLTFALILSTRMGIYQEDLFTTYGKHAKEALFYTHALPLPFFLLLSPDIVHHWNVCLASPPVSVPIIGVSAPIMVLHLLANICLQYVCIFSVFVLTTECTSLTASLVLTVRKFISVIFSIWYFQNPFTGTHWVGTGLVFVGVLLFSDIPGYMKKQRISTLKKQS